MEHVGLIEHNICFLKEKTPSICHSLQFECIPALVLIQMVLQTLPFMNSFPQKGGLKHYPPSAIMMSVQLHMCISQVQLKFGNYCQVAEDVTPCNSLAAHTHGAISMVPSGILSGGQCFLALDTGKRIVRNCWNELPMLLDVINSANVLGHAKCSMLVFTDCLGQAIGNYAHNVNEEDEFVVSDLYSSILPALDKMP